MKPTIATILDDGRARAGLTNRDLWVAYYSLGGFVSPDDLDSFLAGDTVPASADYNLIAQALNDVFIARGDNHPIPYYEDLAER